MTFRNHQYEMVDGIHLPDANKGDNVYYTFPIQNGLGITLMEYEFILPADITSSDDFSTAEEIQVRLLTPKVGTFAVVCVATISVGAKRIVDRIVRVLKVY